MGFSKYFLIVICLLNGRSYAEVSVLFSPHGGIRERLIQELDNAQVSVDVAIYSFSDPALLKKVKSLPAKGIKVRLILDSALSEKERAHDLELSGIDVKYVTIVMHHKFAIIDGPQARNDSASMATLLSGSFNWADSAETSYDEDFLVFKNEEPTILAFQNEFNLIWNKARDFEGPAEKRIETMVMIVPDSTVTFTSANMLAEKKGTDWVFRPKTKNLSEGVAGRVIIQAIQDAKDEIQIASAHFRRPDIYEALVAALKRNVRVEMVLDAQEFQGNDFEKLPMGDSKHLDEKLAIHGAFVRYKMYSKFWDYRTAKQLHSKYMVIDGQKILTGSFNWSKNAEFKSFENLITLDAEKVLNYQQNFRKIFNYGESHFESLLNEISKSSGRGPCVFAPISLTAKEVETLRQSYAKGACRKRK